MSRSAARIASPEQYLLEVRSGLYRGARHRLDPGRHVVGSAAGADVLLMEAALAPAHAAVVLAGGTMRVEGLADGVSVEGAGPVPVGSARTVRLPAVVQIGEIRMAWGVEAPAPAAGPSPRGRPTPTSRAVAAAAAGGPAPQPRSGGALASLRTLLRRPAIPALAAAGILAVTISLTIADPKIGRSFAAQAARPEAMDARGETAARSIQSPISVPSPGARSDAAKRVADLASADPNVKLKLIGGGAAPSSPSVRSTQVAAEHVAASLADDVRQAGLLNVRVAASGNAVVASGSIEPAMADRWASVQHGYDGRFAGEAPLLSSVAKRAEKLPDALRIEGVWRGRNPYIVIGGQRYLVGARMSDGWAIRGIEKDRVLLERDGRHVAMRY